LVKREVEKKIIPQRTTTSDKRGTAIAAGVAEEAEQGFIPCVAAGFGAAPHSKKGGYLT